MILKNTKISLNFSSKPIKKKWHKKKWRIIPKRPKRQFPPKFLINSTKVRLWRIDKWKRLRFTYRENLRLKISISLLFDTRFSLKILKKEIFKNKVQFLRHQKFNCILQLFFRIDILLWKLGFFRSSFQVLQYLRNNSVYLNDKSVKFASNLKSGDILRFKDSFLFTYSCTYLRPTFLYSILEIDYYTSQIIILKDSSKLTTVDASLILQEYIRVQSFINFLQLK
jgi:hypothetical protein